MKRLLKKRKLEKELEEKSEKSKLSPSHKRERSTDKKRKETINKDDDIFPKDISEMISDKETKIEELKENNDNMNIDQDVVQMEDVIEINIDQKNRN